VAWPFVLATGIYPDVVREPQAACSSPVNKRRRGHGSPLNGGPPGPVIISRSKPPIKEIGYRRAPKSGAERSYNREKRKSCGLLASARRRMLNIPVRD
jgi:hypothetical protein